jgi:predicted RNase H-like nuclease (RuvC/YqgF family)
LLAQQVELCNLKVADNDHRDQLERQNATRVQKLLEQELEDLQSENSGLAAMISGQNLSIEGLRSDCDRWRE